MKYSTRDIASFLRLYAVTAGDTHPGMTLEQQVEAALKGGCTCIQLREKNIPAADYIKKAKAVHAITRRYNVPLIINDSVETAAASGAEGVHLGANDMNAKEARKILGDGIIIGVSTHNPAEARQAAADGADYIGIGAVFSTATKTDATVLPHSAISATSGATGLPAVAIGGITAANIGCLQGSGIAGVAVVSAIFGKENITEAAQELRKKADMLFGNEPAAVRPAVLTIAGSDCSGGAGIQADIKTFESCGVYGMSVITAVVAENTCGLYQRKRRLFRANTAILDIPPQHIAAQLAAVFCDIPPAAVKIGMIHTPGAAAAVGHFLAHCGTDIPVVTDPVMAAKDGGRLMNAQSEKILKNVIFPLTFMLTPNIPEAERLSGISVNGENDRRNAALEICRRYRCTTVLIKGGHETDSTESTDTLYDSRDGSWFCVTAPRIHTVNTHGTGCTYASAIAAFLAQGYTAQHAVEHAKAYITGAIGHSLPLGKGAGPLNHGWQHGAR